MKTLILALSCVVLLTACSTPSTVESRKKERAAAYVAWGKPTKMISEGTTTTWLYQDSELKEHKSMTVRATQQGFSGISTFTEETSVLYPHLVVLAKIVFTNGVVKEWQRFDQPTY